MASWKENRMVGIVVGVAAAIFIAIAIIGIINKVMPQKPSGLAPLAEPEE